jgi:hypothetical protein
MKRTCLFSGVAWMLVAFSAGGQPAPPVTYQGELALDGQPITGSCDIRFRLFDAASGGSVVAGPHLASGVVVVDGRFAAPITGWTATSWSGERWLEIAVACPDGGALTVLAPRNPVTSAPTAALAHLSASTDALQLRPVSSVAPAPGQALKWNGTAWAPAADANTTYTAGSGLILSGTQFSVNYAGSGAASTVARSDHGHFGASWNGTASSGLVVSNGAAGGVGVDGIASGTAGVGVRGDGPEVGVWGRTSSTSGAGVYGRASAGTGTTYGVQGESNSTSGHGVYGIASTSSGTTYGVRGLSSSTSGRGVQGVASAATGSTFGVVGLASSSNGAGVIGQATANNSNAIGVWGFATQPLAYAGFFNGRVHVTGNLSAGGTKPFKIDHPLDPANRYLYHFAVESPEVRNVYDGVATLDGNGTAKVRLPAYFSALNSGDYRYQLTPIGAAMPDLHIAGEIAGNAFSLAGGMPGMRVSWQVTAVRNDPYLRDHPVAAEVEKSPEERGRYLYPQGHGKAEPDGLRPRPELDQAVPDRPLLDP